MRIGRRTKDRRIDWLMKGLGGDSGSGDAEGSDASADEAVAQKERSA